MDLIKTALDLIFLLRVLLNLSYFLEIHYWKAYERSLEAVVQRYSVKKLFLEISQNSQENTFARDSFLRKSQA